MPSCDERERFMKFVDASGGPDACHLWVGGTYRNRRGVPYGKLRVGKKIVAAHRYAVKLAGRRLRRDQQVLHSCDRTLCVNERHLKAGTQSQNMRDALAKGRLRLDRQRGDNGRFVAAEAAPCPA